MLGLNLLSLIVSLLALAAPAQGLLRSQVEDEVASARVCFTRCILRRELSDTYVNARRLQA